MMVLKQTGCPFVPFNKGVKRGWKRKNAANAEEQNLRKARTLSLSDQAKCR